MRPEAGEVGDATTEERSLDYAGPDAPTPRPWARWVVAFLAILIPLALVVTLAALIVRSILTPVDS